VKGSSSCFDTSTEKRASNAVISAGDRFGLLTVRCAVDEETRASRRRFECVCDCGNKVVVRAPSLYGKHTRSCGCLRFAAHAKTHGLSGTKEYDLLHKIKRRCLNSSDPAFQNYGGRGIEVAAEWLGQGGFERFFEHVGKAPSPHHTLDRIDNNRGYEPGNVRWATRAEQSRNTRRTVHIHAFGKTLPMTDWCAEYGLYRNAIRERMGYGWDMPRAIAERLVCAKVRRHRPPMLEACVVLSTSGSICFEHCPEGRSAGYIPDSAVLWEVLWDRREALGGVAHSHPGTGIPAPSHTDLSTFAAVECALGRRLTWWISSSTDTIALVWGGPDRLHYVAEQIHPEPDWVSRLRALSHINPRHENSQGDGTYDPGT